MKLPKITWLWIETGLRTLAPIAISAIISSLVLILWRGGWPIETAESRIQWLGITLIVLSVLLAIWLVFKNIKTATAKGGLFEVSINEDNEDNNGE